MVSIESVNNLLSLNYYMDFAQFLYVSVLSFRYPSHSFSVSFLAISCAFCCSPFFVGCPFSVCLLQCYYVVWATVVSIWWAMVAQKWKCNSKQHINNLQKGSAERIRIGSFLPFSSWEVLKPIGVLFNQLETDNNNEMLKFSLSSLRFRSNPL